MVPFLATSRLTPSSTGFSERNTVLAPLIRRAKSELFAWLAIAQHAAMDNTSYLFSSLILPSVSCQVLVFALFTKRCFTRSSVRHVMTRRYRIGHCHLLAPMGADSVACSWRRSKIFCSFLSLAKSNALQLPSQTGLSCNHIIILGLFQFDGRGLGIISYKTGRRLISRRYSRFCGRMDAFGCFDHGLLAKEKRLVPSSFIRPIDSTFRIFLRVLHLQINSLTYTVLLYSCLLRWMGCMSLFLTSPTGWYHDTFSSSSSLSLASFFVGMPSTSSTTRILSLLHLNSILPFFKEGSIQKSVCKERKNITKLVQEQGKDEKDPEKWRMRLNRLWNFYSNFYFWSLVLFDFWVPKIPKIES